MGEIASPKNHVDGQEDVINERGPLLGRTSNDAFLRSPSERTSTTLSGADPWDDSEETKSTTYLILLTTAMLGLQIGWSVEMASVSPFLLSLGISKSLLALVWIAGPLSGTLVQPYVGIRSDNCRLAFGRRRPFMVGGTLATMFSLLALAWTREIVSSFARIFGVIIAIEQTSSAYQIFAVILIYILDFAINVLQAAVRAFIVDSVPTHQQEAGNAWASRISGIGHIATYLVGFVYLPSIFPWLGDTQFKVFVALACVVMSSTMAISCLSISERDPRTLGPPTDRDGGVIAFFKALFRSIRMLPPQVRKVCIVQICAWIGWFPYLFYSTTYIGGLYADPFFKENPNMTEEQINQIWEDGTRLGTLALLVFAIMTFASSVFLPMIIPPTYAPANGNGSNTRATPLTRSPSTPRSSYFDSTAQKPNRILRLRRLIDPTYLQIKSLTLRRAWLLSHLAFFFLTWLTFFIRTPTAGIILIGLIGIPWALTNWAPFALIAAEISRRDAEKRGLRPSKHNHVPPISPGPSAAIFPHPSSSSTDLEALVRASMSSERDRERPLHGSQVLGNNEASTAALTSQSLPAASEDETADQAGVLLGIHNVAISAPQVIATLVSSAMFHALQKPRGTPGDDSVGWVLRFGGVCALAAAWATRSVEENARR